MGLKLSLFVAFVLCAVVFSSLATAIDLQASGSTIEITPCSAGKLSLWLTGAVPGKTVFFSANQNELSIVFDSPTAIAGPNGAAGTAAWISSPACFEGTRLVYFTASACDADGRNCDAKSLAVHVAVRPCAGQKCSSTTLVNQPREAFVPARDCGSGNCADALSRIEFTQYFSPTAKAISIDRYSSPYCPPKPANSCSFDTLAPGAAYVVSFKATNQGAPGTFAIALSPSDDALAASPSTTSIDLSRGEERIVSFVIRASPQASAGLHEISLKAFSDGIVLAEKKWLVEVRSPEEAVLTLPAVPGQGIQVPACKLPAVLSIPAELENRGSAAADFLVQATLNGQLLFSRNIRIEPGLVASFPVQIDSGRLASGENDVVITASSGGLFGSGVARIFVTKCAAVEVVPVSPQQNAVAENGIITITATVFNNGLAPLNNVSAFVSGLPANWSYIAQTISVIPPGSEANLTIKIFTASNERVDGAQLVITSNGVEVARVTLPTLNGSPSGATGFFAGALSSPLLLFILILALAAAFFYYAHTKTSGPAGAGSSGGAKQGGGQNGAGKPSGPGGTGSGNGPSEMNKPTRDYIERLKRIRTEALGENAGNEAGSKHGGSAKEITWVSETRKTGPAAGGHGGDETSVFDGEPT